MRTASSGVNPNPDRAALEATCRANLRERDGPPSSRAVGPAHQRGPDHLSRRSRAPPSRRDCGAALRGVGGAVILWTRYPACRQLYEGTIALGGACTLSDECADSDPQLQQRRTAFARPAWPYAQDWRILQRRPRARPELTLRALILRPAPPRSARPRHQTAPRVDRDLDCASAFCVANVCGPPTLCNGF